MPALHCRHFSPRCLPTVVCRSPAAGGTASSAGRAASCRRSTVHWMSWRRAKCCSHISTCWAPAPRRRRQPAAALRPARDQVGAEPASGLLGRRAAPMAGCWHLPGWAGSWLASAPASRHLPTSGSSHPAGCPLFPCRRRRHGRRERQSLDHAGPLHACLPECS